MVVDVVSSMTMGSVSNLEEAKKDLVKDVHRLAPLGIRLEDSPNGGGFMVHHNPKSSMMV